MATIQAKVCDGCHNVIKKDRVISISDDNAVHVPWLENCSQPTKIQDAIFVGSGYIKAGDWCCECFCGHLFNTSPKEYNVRGDDPFNCSRCGESMSNCGSYHACPDDHNYQRRGR
jgi:hypothetical protein